jgi:predicted AAA+ superfamily ATPase
MPFRFADICTLYGEHPQMLLPLYFRYGGMPQVWQTDNGEEREQYLKDLFDKVYFSDIIGRYHLRGVEEIGIITDVLASSVGSLTNTLNIRNTFLSERKSRISPNTVSSYIGYLKDSFLLSEAQRYDIKGRQYIGAQHKYYFTDLGLRNARLLFRQQDDGHLMENIIYNELLARRMSVDVGIVPVSEKNEEGKLVRKQYEVDFVVNSGSRRYYIQSAFEMQSEEKRAQETHSFRKIADGFKRIIIQNAPVVPWHDNNGILTISLTDFLLQHEALDW